MDPCFRRGDIVGFGFPQQILFSPQFHCGFSSLFQRPRDRAIAQAGLGKLTQVFKIDNIITVQVSRYVATGIKPVLCEPRKVIKRNEAQGSARPKTAKHLIIPTFAPIRIRLTNCTRKRIWPAGACPSAAVNCAPVQLILPACPSEGRESQKHCKGYYHTKSNGTNSGSLSRANVIRNSTHSPPPFFATLRVSETRGLRTLSIPFSSGKP